ncbi:MAG: hypothetical protein IJ840_09225 [Bacteroidales bacterium]|nr:hypothetical protein [Bacteroidales bacterium]
MKKILFALLGIGLLFTACTDEDEIYQNPYRIIVEYQPSTFTINGITGNVTPDGDYDWITSNGGGSFTVRRNTTGLIRRAEFTVSGSKDKAVVSQRAHSLDGVVSTVLSGQSLGSASVDLILSTSFPEDYESWGIIYGKTSNRESGKEVPQTGAPQSGKNTGMISGLEEGVDYYAWTYVVSTEGDKLYSGAIGILPPVYVQKGEDLQAAIDGAKDFSEVRILGADSGVEYTGPIALKNSVTISGGWNSDFSGQSPDNRTVIKGKNGVVFTTAGLQDGATISYLDISGGSNPNEGGAMQLDAGSKLTIEFCNIHDNYSGDQGGAIKVMEGAKLFVANSIFKDNAGNHHGGAIAASSKCEVTLINSLFDHNLSLKRNGYSGAIFLQDGVKAVMVNCTAVNNVNWPDSGSSYDSWPTVAFRGSGTSLVFCNNIVVGNMFYPYDANVEGLDLSVPSSYATIVPVQRQHESVMIRCVRDNPDLTHVISSNLIEGAFGWHSVNVDQINAANTFTAVGFDLSTVFKAPASGDYTPVGSALKGELSSAVKEALGKYDTDLAGNPRITDGTINIGCYQVQ